MKVLLIDSASPEVNRGSYCYTPYLAYSFFKSQGHQVTFFENATVAKDMDNLKRLSEKMDLTIIFIWSYPQIETAMWFWRELRGKVEFEGYKPLIKHLSLPVFKGLDYVEAMIHYPKYFDNFDYVLLSDCDMHLAKYDAPVVPLFLSFGCRNHCSFCPVGANHLKRDQVPFEYVERMIDAAIGFGGGHSNIHFTDENFFDDPVFVEKVLQILERKKIKYIVLTTIQSLNVMVKRVGVKGLLDSGLALAEVGLESASLTLSKAMNKPTKEEHLNWLLENKGEIDIFWLALTFFPGETVRSLELTGEFMLEHGYKMDEVHPRLVTNSTVGGLGQFFQYYHGTKMEIGKEGKILSGRPMRLYPSFIPHSFLNEIVSLKYNKPLNFIRNWLDVYNLLEVSETWFSDSGKISIDDFIFHPGFNPTQRAIWMALMARLGALEATQ